MPHWLCDTPGHRSYLTHQQRQGRQSCTATSRTSAWPPLTTTATNVTGGQGVAGITTTKDANGTQVTDAGLPLYRFSGDTTTGDANGDGLTASAAPGTS